MESAIQAHCSKIDLPSRLVIFVQFVAIDRRCIPYVQLRPTPSPTVIDDPLRSEEISFYLLAHCDNRSRHGVRYLNTVNEVKAYVTFEIQSSIVLVLCLRLIREDVVCCNIESRVSQSHVGYPQISISSRAKTTSLSSSKD